MQTAGCLNHEVVLGGVGGNIKCWLGNNQAAIVSRGFQGDGVEESCGGCYSSNTGFDSHTIFTSTTRAGQGNTTAMGSNVPLQIGVHDKLFRAIWAFEVFARGVCAKVELKVGRVRKAFIAMCALKGSLTRMGAFMLQTEI